MAVKRSLSAARMLLVFEQISRLQPIGVSALARQLGADKSAVQRDVMTLADAGWIRPAAGARGMWELSLHILALARPPHSSGNLRVRLRPILEQVRAEIDETVYLTVPHQNRFVVLDALESPHMLRIVPTLGMIVPVKGTATAKAILPYLSPERQSQLLGWPPDEALRQAFAMTLEQGYAISDGEVVPGSVSLASAIFASDGQPCGALVVTGPADRIAPARWPEIGTRLRNAAQLASRAWPLVPIEEPELS